MAIGVSVLRAMVALDAERIRVVQQEVPSVVIRGVQREVGTRALAREAVESLLAELVPQDVRSALDDVGAIRYELPAIGPEHFTVVAIAGGALRVEIRREHPDATLQLPSAQSLWPSA